MIDYKNIRETVCRGLKEYLGIPVIRNNQNRDPPNYPYVSYTVTTLANANKGTYGEFTDGIDRKNVKQTWSITAQSDNNDESVELAYKVREWLEHVGRLYLSKNKVIVEQVTNITNRDNIVTIDYEYKNGFDVVFVMFDEILKPDNGYIDTVEWR